MVDVSQDSFEYEPLLTKTSIRLACLVYALGQTQEDKALPSLNCEVPQIQLALETVDLEDNPAYEALSYTWGSPFPDSSEKAKAYQGVNGQRSILINGRVHSITRNLYEFLHHIQQTMRNVDERTQPFNKTELIKAAELGDWDSTYDCLCNGADLTAQDTFGETALHYAAENGHFEIVRLLAYCRSDMSCLDRRGRTALDCAKHRKRRQYAEIIDFLEKGDPFMNNEEIPPKYVLKSRIMSQRFWIDSICINQNDIPERNAQVSIMSQIYSKAVLVIGWLGVQDDFTEPASQALEDLGRGEGWDMEGGKGGIKGWLMYIRANGLGRVSMEEFISKELTPFQARQCVAIAQLLERTWFHRVWVIQEFALAAQIRMVCGSVRINYGAIMMLYFYLCGERETTFPSYMNQSKSFLESAKREGVSGIEAIVMADVRARTTKHSSIREDLLNKMTSSSGISPVSTWASKLSLQVLSTMVWVFEASDPRDKVFALLGLARAQDPDREIAADYSMPTAELFIRYGKIYMEGSPDEPVQELLTGKCHVFECLEGLSYVQNTNSPHPQFLNYRSELPSWTPNFSAPLSMSRIWSSRFSAGIAPDSTAALPGQASSRVLNVNGLLFDEIVSTEPCCWVNDNQYIRIPLFWLGMILDLDPRYIIDGNRVEALLRTLTADVFSKSPEAEACARGCFREFMLWNLGISLDHPCQGSWVAQVRETDTLNLLPSLEEIKHICEHHNRGSRLELNPRRCFDMAMGHHYHDRRLFHTKMGYLGLGPMAVEPGDEIWLVSGARTPFLLRRLSSDSRPGVSDDFVQPGHSNSRTFIGESYVHGIMHGEGLSPASHSQFSLVSLV